jgi:hypothetical protein
MHLFRIALSAAKRAAEGTPGRVGGRGILLLRATARCGLLPLLLCLASPGPSVAAPPERPAPPVLRAGFERIKGRLEKELTLKVAGDPMGVEFEVDTRATKGKLTPLTANFSHLRYTPPADPAVTRDSFLYRAKRAQTYSSWETFHLALLEAGPRLQVPSVLDFGTLQLGERKTLPLTLLNSGDAVASEEISIQKPWTLDPAVTRIEIPPNQEFTVRVQIRAESVGKILGEVSIGRGNSYVPVPLQAEVSRWMEWSPSKLTLRPSQNTPGQWIRSAPLTLKNTTALAETFQLESKGDLEHPPEVALQPGESRTLSVRLKSADPGAARGGLVIRTSPAGSPPDADIERSQLIPWECPGLPALLEKQLKPPGDPRIFHSLLTLTNRGGTAGSWTLTTSGSFLLGSTGSLQVALSPQQTRDILIREIPGKKSPSEAPSPPPKIEFSGPDGASSLPLSSLPLSSRTSPSQPPLQPPPTRTVPAPPPPGASSPHTAPAPTPPPSAEVVRLGPPKSSAAPSPKTPPKTSRPPADVIHLAAEKDFAPRHNRSEQDFQTYQEIFTNSFVPIVPGLILKDLTPHTATLILPFPPTPPTNFPLLFHGKFKPDSETGLDRDWKPLQYDDPTRDAAGRLVYRIRGLEPNTTVTLRILGPLLQTGKRQALHEQDFQTPPTPHRDILRTSILGVITAAALALWIRIRRS